MTLDSALVDAYCDASHIPPWQLERLLREANQDDVKLAQCLVREEWLDRASAARILSDAKGVAYVTLTQTLFQKALLEKLPREFAERHQAIPLYHFGSHVTVAMAYPEDKNTVRTLENVMMAKISPVFSFPDEIARAIQINYHDEADLDRLVAKFDLKQLRSVDAANDPALLERLTSNKHVIELADAIILLGVRDRASDIHIETKRHSVKVRYRIDGMLYDRLFVPREVANALVARIKVMARMDIIERRRPQDGRITLQLPADAVDLRVSSVPSLHGEKLVLRLIGMRLSQDRVALDKMGFSESILDSLKQVLRNPNGLLLVSGPTGSGKSTTLYAALNHINDPSLNIVTIEDPVEYDIASITQIAVSYKEGRTFETLLRSVLRQDPDVILVGEIRDMETARVVAQAALTGHLVLTTLHTGSALQALTRLVEMGVERFIVAPSIIGVMGQRLVRKLCELCRVEYQPTAEELQQVFYWTPGSITLPKLYRPQGCHHCGQTGYNGRIAIHEFLRVDSLVRDAILQGKEFHEVAAIARKQGFKDVRYDGFCKALLGLTTIDEVLRVTADQVAAG